MASNEYKVSKFVEAITAYAEEQRDKILLDAETFKVERLQKAEEEVLTDAYRLIQKETAELRSEVMREMSRRDMSARKEVLNRRTQIMDEVFKRCEIKLGEFTSGPEYEDYMKNILKAMFTLMTTEGTTYIISTKDQHLSDKLSAICPDGCRIEVTDDIRIGGIRAINPINGQIIDNTLDSKLQSQRDWFTATSGLTVE